LCNPENGLLIIQKKADKKAPKPAFWSLFTGQYDGPQKARFVDAPFIRYGEPLLDGSMFY
jgi:hypothetical protein